MHATEGDYRVVTFCRHSNASSGASPSWQARADVYLWNDKKPSHCVYSRHGFRNCMDAKNVALKAGVSWARRTHTPIAPE